MSGGSQWAANEPGSIGGYVRRLVGTPGWSHLTPLTAGIVVVVTIGQLWQVISLLGQIGPTADSCNEGFCGVGPMLLGVWAASIVLVTVLWVWGRRLPLIVADALVLLGTLGEGGTLSWNGQLWVATALVGIAGGAFLEVRTRQRGTRPLSG
jgi:hypothetical protein